MTRFATTATTTAILSRFRGRAPARKKPPQAPRAFWFDPRFGIGIALVACSVLGVLFLVQSIDHTTAVWAARTVLTPGDVVTRNDLVQRNVRLGEAGDLYLRADRLPTAGVVVTQTIIAGELVPESSVGSLRGVDAASVVITVAGELPKAIAAGSIVDLWSAAKAEAGGFGTPTILVPSATVVRLVDEKQLIASNSSTGVELLVPRGSIAAVLEAVADDNAISVVPADLPVGAASDGSPMAPAPTGGR